ncbi:hypothetical protein [Streptomyces massasporeus]
MLLVLVADAAAGPVVVIVLVAQHRVIGPVQLTLCVFLVVHTLRPLP